MRKTEMSTPRTALSAYTASTQLWIAPNAAVHGTAVSVAGIGVADLPGFLPRGAPV